MSLFRRSEFGRTDVGMARDHNEDRYLFADLTTLDTSLGASQHDFKALLATSPHLVPMPDPMGGN